MLKGVITLILIGSILCGIMLFWLDTQSGQQEPTKLHRQGILCDATESILSDGWARTGNITYTEKKQWETPKFANWQGVASVTAYSSSPDETWGDPTITADGSKVYYGTIACPSSLPFGTEIEFEGLGTFTCHDRGPAITANHFDVWHSSKGEALAFGRKNINYRIK